MTTNYHDALDGTVPYNMSAGLEARFASLDEGVTNNATAIVGKADISHTHELTDINGYSQPIIIPAMYNGVLPASVVICRFKTPIAYTLPSGLTGSLAESVISATASTVFSLKKAGVEFGTLTFAAGSSVGVFSAASGVSFAVGEVLTIVAPSTADDTLSDVCASILGTRS